MSPAPKFLSAPQRGHTHASTPPSRRLPSVTGGWMPKLFAGSQLMGEVFLLTSSFIEPKGCRFDNAEFRIIPSKHGERHADGGFIRIGSALSEVVQESEQGVAGLERSEALSRRCYRLDRLFFCFQVCFNVNLCCRPSEPQHEPTSRVSHFLRIGAPFG
jgi:hypothetical protein